MKIENILKDTIKDCEYVAGVSINGEKSLAGDMLVCSVILNKDKKIDNLINYKKLSKKKINELYFEILDNSYSCCVYYVQATDFANKTLLDAKLDSIKVVIESMAKVDFAIIRDDGVSIKENLKLDIDFDFVHKSERNIECVNAANIVARLTREKMMQEFSRFYPNFNFKKHKGYETKEHLEEIKKYGLIKKFHRVFLFHHIDKLGLINKYDETFPIN